MRKYIKLVVAYRKIQRKEESTLFFLLVIETEEEKRKFVLLYEKYNNLMYTIAKDILTDKYLSEDAVQDAFWKVAKNMDKVKEVDSLATKRYIISITKSSAIDIYRKRRRQMKREIYVDELGEQASLVYMETDVDNRVLDILKNLPIKYRDVFLLKYSGKLENKKIAEILGIPEGTVRQRIARGKVLVQQALDEMENS